jgi:hypothetical protein
MGLGKLVMSCDCGCGGLSPAQKMVLATIRSTELRNLPDKEWEIVVSEVEKAGSIQATHGSVNRILTEAIQKAGFGGDRSAAGRFAAEQRWLNHQKKQDVAQPQKAQADVTTNDHKEAFEALLQGKTVSMAEVSDVNTVIKDLHDFAQEAKKKGEKVKLNLCKISVPGTNLFCGDALMGDDGKPIPRSKMPQLAGKAKAGSKADDEKNFPKDDEGEVNVGDAFVKHLASQGVSTREGEVPAATLKASQSELKGSNVAFMMSEKGQKEIGLDDTAIFVSRDGYVIDGHHRWAAKVGMDTKDGKLGGKKIKVRVIDMDIRTVLDAANAFTSELGIEPKTA